MRTALLSVFHALQPVPHLGQGGARRTLARPVTLWVSEPLDHRASPVIRDFLWRAEASAAIEHPAIAPVLDLDEAEGRLYFVTPTTEARTLDEELGHTGPMSPSEAVDLLTGIADGLDVAHAKGLTHGAISPAMIWVDHGSDHGAPAHLVGFGLEALLRARARGDHRDLLLDEVVYIAPEQLRGDDGGSDRADQYAFACALYHCVSGGPPFVRDRTSALFGAHMLARPTTPASGDSGFDEAVLTAMAKDPEQRFDSCATLLEAAAGRPIPRSQVRREHGHEQALEWNDETPAPNRESDAGDTAIQAGAGATVLPVTPAVTPAADARRRPVGAWLAWSAVGLLVLVMVAGAAALATGLLTRETEEPPERPRQDAPEPADEAGAADAPEAADEAGAADAPEAATIAWQREIGDEAVTHIAVEDLNAVAATGNNLTVVNPLTGSRRWRKVADVGILTDLTTTGDVLVYRTDVLSGVSMSYGVQLWESNDVLPAPGGLSTGGSEVYAISIGRSLPELSAVDPRNGKELWHYHGRQVLVDNDAAVGTGGELVVLLQRGAMIGIDPRRERVVTDDGDHVEITDEQWRMDIANPWIETLATSETEAVFALQNGSVCAHALSDGDKRWCVQVGGVRDGAPGLLLRNETVVVVSRDEVVALDMSSGQQRWEAEAAEPFLPFVAADSGLVYIADTAGTLHAFTLTDGEPQWEMTAPGEITALVGADGGVIIGTEDGALARIEPTADG